MAQSPPPPRQGSVYIAVTGAAVLVSIISMTAMHLARLELRTATSMQNIAYARSIALSSAEYAVGRIDLDPNWRNNFNHDTPYTATPNGTNISLQFKLFDHADGDIGNDNTQPVEVRGIGQYGNATQLYSVTYAPSLSTSETIGPMTLKSFDTSGGNSASEDIYQQTWLGQYFLPELPATAVDWCITDIDISAQQDGSSNATLYVRLYEADAGGMPTNLIESTSIDKPNLPTGGFDWVNRTFSAAVGLTPGNGLCLCLEGSHPNKKVKVQYESDGVSATNSHMITGGNGSWSTTDPNKSLFYRIHGLYKTSSGSTGKFTLQPGSWRPTAAN